jgi:hypothetical protein
LTIACRCGKLRKVRKPLQDSDWAFRNGGSSHDWSEPIFACGGKSRGKGGAVFTDARKSAVTDGLTQAAFMIGVGHQVFKGPVLARGGNGRKQGGNGKKQKADATTFWALYNTRARQAATEAVYASGAIEAALAEVRARATRGREALRGKAICLLVRLDERVRLLGHPLPLAVHGEAVAKLTYPN